MEDVYKLIFCKMVAEFNAENIKEIKLWNRSASVFVFSWIKSCDDF